MRFRKRTARKRSFKDTRWKATAHCRLWRICCVLEDEAECVREDLFQAYRDYCLKNGFKPMSQANFNKDVESYGDQICRAVDKLGKRRTWRGLRLRE
ncbi:MAG: primase-like DNA-binding domain-containing protein [Anaerovoracaceae bacterium]